MARGKQTCRILKEIRHRIAEANDIELITSECTFKGNCLGTCPKCEAEVRYLEQQLRARSIAGKAVALAGISSTALALLASSPAEAQDVQLIQNAEKHTTIMREPIAAAADTFIVKGRVLSGDTLPDGSLENLPLEYAIIENRRLGIETRSDTAGYFNIKATQGDLLIISYIGFKDKAIVASKEREDITVSLVPQLVLLGEILPPRYVNCPYIELNILDEYGRHFKMGDIDIKRVTSYENGDEDYQDLMAVWYDKNTPYCVYWDAYNGLRNPDGSLLKEATFLIEAKGYELIRIDVKAPEGPTKRTLRFQHRIKR